MKIIQIRQIIENKQNICLLIEDSNNIFYNFYIELKKIVIGGICYNIENTFKIAGIHLFAILDIYKYKGYGFTFNRLNKINM